MLNKREYEERNKSKGTQRIYFPINSYAQMKSGEDTHFMSCDNKSDDNFIELTEDGVNDLFQQISAYNTDIFIKNIQKAISQNFYQMNGDS